MGEIEWVYFSLWICCIFLFFLQLREISSLEEQGFSYSVRQLGVREEKKD